MKKFANVLMMITMLILINGLAFGMLPTAISDDVTIYHNDMLSGYEFVIEGGAILPSNNISINLYNIGGADSLIMIADCSSGNITTASIIFKDFLDNSKLSNVIIDGIITTNIVASNALITIYNPVTITNNVTINFLLRY